MKKKNKPSPKPSQAPLAISLTYAHTWKELGEERIRRWPQQGELSTRTVPAELAGPRGIKVDISSWIGTSVGARHYYCNVTEEENQWWDEPNNRWVRLSCDTSNAGYTFKADVFTEDEAIALAAVFCAAIFKTHPETHHIEWDGPHDAPQWVQDLWEAERARKYKT